MKKIHITVEPYTEEDLIKLEHCIMNSKQYVCNAAGEFLRLRDLTILKLAVYSGMREGEVLNLKWSDIDWDKGLAYINPYTNKERNADPIVLNNKSLSILKSWKEVFSKYYCCAYCFPSIFTFEPITSSCCRKRMLALSREAGVGRTIWYTANGQPVNNKRFNSARKYFASKIMRITKDPYLTMRALRQTTLKSVTQYAYLANEDIQKKQNEIF